MGIFEPKFLFFLIKTIFLSGHTQVAFKLSTGLPLSVCDLRVRVDRPDRSLGVPLMAWQPCWVSKYVYGLKLTQILNCVTRSLT